VTTSTSRDVGGDPAPEPVRTPPAPSLVGALAGSPVFVGADRAGGRTLQAELEHVVGALRHDGPDSAGRAALTELLWAWADSLVVVHRTPVTGTEPVAPRPWILDPAHRDTWTSPAATVAGTAWAVREHPATRRAIAQAGAGWQATGWAHGDTGAGVVVTRVGDAGPRTELVAGTGSGLGDARWDVACALDWLAVGLGVALDPEWRIDPVGGFLAAYRTLGGTFEPTRALAVARTVMTAVEWSMHVGARDLEPDEADAAWLATLWARPLDLVTSSRRATTPHRR